MAGINCNELMAQLDDISRIKKSFVTTSSNVDGNEVTSCIRQEFNSLMVKKEKKNFEDVEVSGEDQGRDHQLKAALEASQATSPMHRSTRKSRP